MKKIVTVIAVLAVAVTATAQNFFDDAHMLYRIRENLATTNLTPSRDDVLDATDILVRRLPGFPPNNALRADFAASIEAYAHEVRAYFSARTLPNPFIGAEDLAFLFRFGEEQNALNEPRLDESDLRESLADELFRFSETADGGSVIDEVVSGLGLPGLLDSVVTFLVNRAQLEAAGYLLNELAAILRAYPEFAVLLPRTTATFEAILTSLRGLDTALPRLRYAFADDMGRLPRSLLALPGLADSAEDPEAAGRGAGYRAFFADPDNEPIVYALGLVQSIAEGESIDLIFRRLARLAAGRPDAPVSQVVLLVREVSDSLRRSSLGDIAWVQEADVLELLQSNSFQRTFFALFWERVAAEGLRIGDRSVADILAQSAAGSRISGLAESFLRLYPLLLEVQRLAFEATSPDLQPAERIRAGIALADALARLFASPQGIGWALVEVDEDLEAALGAFDTFLGYSVEFVESVSENDYERAFAALSTVIDRMALRIEGNGTREVFAQVVEYGAIVAALATAESNDEMTLVLERYAAPAGSYRRKFAQDFSVALNAYVGVTGGLEWDVNAVFSGAPGMFAPFAPIGVSLNFHPHDAEGWPLTVFVGIIDVGMLAQFRLDGSATPLPNLHVANLLAPALHLGVNLGDSPFALGFAVGLSPGFTPSPGTGTVTGTQRFRMTIYGAVDIPIFFF